MAPFVPFAGPNQAQPMSYKSYVPCLPLGKVWYGSLSLASSLVSVCPLSTPGKKNGPFQPRLLDAPGPKSTMRPKPRARATSSRPPPSPKPLHTYKSFSPKKERRQVVRVLSKPSSTEAPFVCDPRRPPLWPRTLTLAAAAAAPPTPTHVPVGVARRARTPSAPCLATENRGRGEISGAGTNFDCGFWSGKPCRKCVSRGRGKNHSSPVKL